MMTNPNPSYTAPQWSWPTGKWMAGVDLAAGPEDAVITFKKFEGSGEDAECQPNPAWQSVDVVFLPLDLAPDGLLRFGFEYLDGKIRVQVSEKDLLEWLRDNSWSYIQWRGIMDALIDQKRRPQ